MWAPSSGLDHSQGNTAPPPPPHHHSGVRPMGTVAYGGKGQGKGKGRGEGQLGQGGRGRSQGGEKLMGTTRRERVQGKGSEWRLASRRRPLQTRSSHHGLMPNPPPPALQMHHSKQPQRHSSTPGRRGPQVLQQQYSDGDGHTAANVPPDPTAGTRTKGK